MKSITGKLIPQIYRDNFDGSPIELPGIEFDATSILLEQGDVETLSNILETYLRHPAPERTAEGIEDFVPEVARARFAEFESRFTTMAAGSTAGINSRIHGLCASIAKFFDVHEGSEIAQKVTQEALDKAREEHAGAEGGTYQVMVTRTETKHAWIEVQATSENEAEQNAIKMTNDSDFYDQPAGTPVFAVEEIEESDPLSQRDTPRARG